MTSITVLAGISVGLAVVCIVRLVREIYEVTTFDRYEGVRWVENMWQSWIGQENQ